MRIGRGYEKWLKGMKRRIGEAVMDEKFEKSVEKILALEGGYVNDREDAGGPTRWGISQRSYPEISIDDLTRDQAIEIYFRDFWGPGRLGEFERREIAEKIFSLGVNMGLRKAIVILQLALIYTGRKVRLDGMVGPATIGAVNGHENAEWLLDKIKLFAVREYASIGKVRFLRGWIERALA
uniref:Putative glycoside hydrolase n=1 Tax=viral metagenome TaxID=1070528 RepID=A0A6M3IS71_9ZZZZ